MELRESILEGLKPVLIQQIKDGIAQGKLKQPVEFALVSESAWKRIRTTPMTSGATMFFHIKREDVDKLIREVFADLKVEVKG